MAQGQGARLWRRCQGEEGVRDGQLYRKYTKKDTGNALCGEEGCELSKSEWWLLLEPVAAAEEWSVCTCLVCAFKMHTVCLEKGSLALLTYTLNTIDFPGDLKI